MSPLSLGECFRQKRNSLNLIRLLAALAVIYGHASAVTGKGPGDLFLQVVSYKFIGGVAVDVFFVISGFLITASAMSRHGLVYYSMSRLLRIYPALIVCVTITVFILGPSLSTSEDYWQSSETWQYFFYNASAYGTQYFLPGVFLNMHDKAINGSLWTLAVEVRLYLIILLLAIAQILKNKTLFNLFFFIAIAIGYFAPDALSIVFPYDNHRQVAMMFMIGSFAWINRDEIPISPPLLLVLLFFAATQHHGPKFGIAYAMLLPYLVFCISFAPWGSWYDRFGDYSYGVYLYGWIAQQYALFQIPSMSNSINTLYGCFGALICAIISWHFIEKPVQQLKFRFKSTNNSESHVGASK